MELYWNFLFFKMGKMEAKMEVSILELYYIAKFRVRKYRKGIVCGKVASTPPEHHKIFSTKYFSTS